MSIQEKRNMLPAIHRIKVSAGWQYGQNETHCYPVSLEDMGFREVVDADTGQVLNCFRGIEIAYDATHGVIVKLIVHPSNIDLDLHVRPRTEEEQDLATKEQREAQQRAIDQEIKEYNEAVEQRRAASLQLRGGTQSE